MNHFKNLFLFMFAFSLGALIWGVVFLFLNKKPIFYSQAKKDYEYYRIYLSSLFFSNVKIKQQNIEVINLKSLQLKAIYKDKKGGFIIVEDNKKTVFVDLNKVYKGFKLIEIGDNYAIFSKNNKNYKIEMKKAKNKLNIVDNKVETKVISKKVFNEYKKNLSKIWKNIGIIRTKEGYKITYINPKSVFAKIGLKRGDVLLEVNGVELKNDMDAWNLYKNSDNFEEVEVKIKRKNRIKILNYELN